MVSQNQAYLLVSSLKRSTGGKWMEGFLPTHEINTAINTHQGTGSHVSDKPIVLNGQVASDIPSTGLHS
jgi:hypothetical protein